MLYNKTVNKMRRDLRQGAFKFIVDQLDEELVSTHWWRLWSHLERNTALIRAGFPSERFGISFKDR